jgi:hypothetical protein
VSENEFDGVLVEASKLKCIPDGSGNEMKVLRVSRETGAWSALIRNVYGPVAFHDEDGGIANVLDWRSIEALVAAAG